MNGTCDSSLMNDTNEKRYTNTGYVCLKKIYRFVLVYLNKYKPITQINKSGMNCVIKGLHLLRYFFLDINRVFLRCHIVNHIVRCRPNCSEYE